MIYFTEFNPIRFIKRQVVGSVEYDYITKFPNPDSFFTNEAYLGISAIPYTPQFIKDVAIDFQLQYNAIDNVTVEVWNKTALLSTLSSPTDITPTGWTGLTDKVYKYTYTPLTTDDIIIRVSDDDNVIYFDSEWLQINESLEGFRKITYVHTNNNLGCVFKDDNSAVVFEPVIYLEIYMKPIISGELETYKDDRGSYETLRPTPEQAYDLQIRKIPDQYLDKITLIFSVTLITINDIRYSPFDKPESEAVGEFTNNNNVSLTVGRVGWNYMQNDDLQGYDYLVDENAIEIVDEFGNKILV